MKYAEPVKPLIPSGWLRALLYCVTLLLSATVIASIYLFRANKKDLTLQSLYNDHDLLWLIEIVFFILVLLVTYVFRRWVDRKSIISIGLEWNKHGGEALAGLLFGIFIVCASSLVLKGTDHLKWMDILFDPKTLFLGFGGIILVAFYEEIIFRGYILNNLMDSFPNWVALIISSIVFIFHSAGNLGIGFFPLMNGLVMGLILGLNYIYTRNLWFSICLHIAWNFMEGPILGFPGYTSFPSLLQTEMKGDENITGGLNGLEGSVILMAVSLLSLLFLYLILRKKTQSRISTSSRSKIRSFPAKG